MNHIGKAQINSQTCLLKNFRNILDFNILHVKLHNQENLKVLMIVKLFKQLIHRIVMNCAMIKQENNLVINKFNV